MSLHPFTPISSANDKKSYPTNILLSPATNRRLAGTGDDIEKIRSALFGMISEDDRYSSNRTSNLDDYSLESSSDDEISDMSSEEDSPIEDLNSHSHTYLLFGEKSEEDNGKTEDGHLPSSSGTPRDATSSSLDSTHPSKAKLPIEFSPQFTRKGYEESTYNKYGILEHEDKYNSKRNSDHSKTGNMRNASINSFGVTTKTLEGKPDVMISPLNATRDKRNRLPNNEISKVNDEIKNEIKKIFFKVLKRDSKQKLSVDISQRNFNDTFVKSLSNGTDLPRNLSDLKKRSLECKPYTPLQEIFHRMIFVNYPHILEFNAGKGGHICTEDMLKIIPL